MKHNSGLVLLLLIVVLVGVFLTACTQAADKLTEVKDEGDVPMTESVEKQTAADIKALEEAAGITPAESGSQPDAEDIDPAEARDIVLEGMAKVDSYVKAAGEAGFSDFDGQVHVGQRVLITIQTLAGKNIAILFYAGDGVCYNYNATLEGFDEATGTVSDMVDFEKLAYKPKDFNIVDGQIKFNLLSDEALRTGKYGAVELNLGGLYATELYRGATGEIYGIVFTEINP